MPLNESYGELAYAILVWDKYRHGEGTRSQQIDSERRLAMVADILRATGYNIGPKK
jgi:hypothetical protein